MMSTSNFPNERAVPHECVEGVSRVSASGDGSRFGSFGGADRPAGFSTDDVRGASGHLVAAAAARRLCAECDPEHGSVTDPVAPDGQRASAVFWLCQFAA